MYKGTVQNWKTLSSSFSLSVKSFRNLIKSKAPDLLEDKTSKRRRFFTPKEVSKIYELIGEPCA